MSQLPPEDLLRKVLVQEQKQAFDNRAMIGGLSAFARNLHSRAAAASAIPEAALLLATYDEDDQDRRRAAVASALAVLDRGPGVQSLGPPLAPAEPADGKGSPSARPSKKAPTPSATSTSPRSTAKPAPSGHIDGVLATPITAIPGIGPKRAQQLGSLGFVTVGDLLYYFPREHLDYRRRDRIRGLRYGERTTILVTVESARVRRVRKNLSITTVIVSDESGRLPVEWFNQPYLEKTFTPGRRVAISGELDSFNGRILFKPRDYEWVDEAELTHSARIVPIYPLKAGLHQKSLRSLIHDAVERFGGLVPDPLPVSIADGFDLPTLPEALRQYHFPADSGQAETARRRLAFDEVLSIQLGLRLRKREWEETGHAPKLSLSPQDRSAFLSSLPFELTAAQQRVAAELERSLASTRPMSRLVQGDVGSGKTVIAALALFAAVRAGYQGALMAPTEILAQQHFKSLSTWLEPLGLSVALLTGATSAKERRAFLESAAAGQADVLVGTHALFQEGVEVGRLGVAVVDEQHRFGVEQRSRLRQKGVSPHLLAMTATPIPRTLQLTLYGDLDISVIDELPPGRIPIETRLTASPNRAYELVGDEVDKGRQAFVVCPVIDESLDDDMKSAVAEHKRLQSQVFPKLRVGLLHGRMKPKEKDAVLASFRDGSYEILVATSVVEVGIDIPNATVMVIRDAHRFGLAQLHQLRGRIGRGGEKSYCVLVSHATEGPPHERLRAVVATQDGFKLAEKDLELRGPGEFWGTRQSGMPELKIAGPGDGPVMEIARQAVDLILGDDPKLQAAKHAGLRAQVDRFWQQEAELH